MRENLLLAVRGLNRPDHGAALGECYGLFPVLKDRQGRTPAASRGGERQMLTIAPRLAGPSS